MRRHFLSALAAMLCVSGSAQDALIKNATVLTVTKGVIEEGDILIRGGKIAAVGKGLSAPQSVQVIDAKGQFAMPGIVDAHSHAAVEGNVNEGALSVTSMVAISDVLDPEDINIYRRLADGVTTANTLHGSANPIGGTNQVIKLRWGGSAKDLLFEGAPKGIKFALGENPKRSNFAATGPARYPGSRMGVMDVIRQAFTDARAYRKAWKEYEAKSKTKDPTALMPRRDLALEPLVEILEGKRLVHAHCYRSDEILQLLRLAEEFGFKITTLQHVLEAYKVAPEIVKHGAGVSCFADRWGYKVEAFDAIPQNAALMVRAGALVSINKLLARKNMAASRTKKL
jgi:imidazolonepropionase-like amidohydrolase